MPVGKVLLGTVIINRAMQVIENYCYLTSKKKKIIWN